MARKNEDQCGLQLQVAGSDKVPMWCTARRNEQLFIPTIFCTASVTHSDLFRTRQRRAGDGIQCELGDFLGLTICRGTYVQRSAPVPICSYSQEMLLPENVLYRMSFGMLRCGMATPLALSLRIACFDFLQPHTGPAPIGWLQGPGFDSTTSAVRSRSLLDTHNTHMRHIFAI